MAVPRTIAGISSGAIEQALAEFDALGRGKYLEKYGFSLMSDRWIVRGDHRYDVDAIVGAAYSFAHPGEPSLRPSELSRGEAKIGQLLKRLGFSLEIVGAAEEPEWHLKPGERTERSDLHDRYGGARHGGIAPCRAPTPYVFLFTAPTSEGEQGDSDRWRGDVFLFAGEGQAGERMFFGNRAISDHAASGRHLHLFRGRVGIVEYLGEVAIDREEPYHVELRPSEHHAGLRRVFVFHLRPVVKDRVRMSPITPAMKADLQPIPVVTQHRRESPAQTVADATEAAFGTAYYGTPLRFDERGWELDGQTTVGCDTCGQPLWALGKPWTSAVGVQYRFWAVACTTCEKVWDLDKYDEPTQTSLRDWRRSVGKEPGRTTNISPKLGPPPEPRPGAGSPQPLLAPRPAPSSALAHRNGGFRRVKPDVRNRRLTAYLRPKLSSRQWETLVEWIRAGSHGVAVGFESDLMPIGLGAINALDDDHLAIVILAACDTTANLWRERLAAHLGIPADEVGALRNGVASLRGRRGVIEVASTAGENLLDVVIEWNRLGRRVLVVVDSDVATGPAYLGRLAAHVHAMLSLQLQGVVPMDDMDVGSSSTRSAERADRSPASDERDVAPGRVVNLYVDLTPLESSMLASIDRDIEAAKAILDDEPPISSGSAWMDWRINFQRNAGARGLEGLLLDERRLVQSASARRRALNDIFDILDLKKRTLVIHESAEAAEKTVMSLSGLWLQAKADHERLNPSVRAQLRQDFENREIAVLVIELGEHELASLPSADVVVLAGGWGQPGRWRQFLDELSRCIVDGALVVTILVRGTSDEAIGAGLDTRIQASTSHHQWSGRGDTVVALRSPSSFTPHIADPDLPSHWLQAKAGRFHPAPALREMCPRCRTDNEPGRLRCVECFARLDRSRERGG